MAKPNGNQVVPAKGAKSPTTERRQFPGAKVIGVAKISVVESEPSMDCIVIDWSQGGAQLRLVEPEKCPDQFTLFTQDGRMTECRVMWRRDAYIGAQFVGPSVSIN
jgi:hypothetical protein